jgi:hypothetical protein
MMTVLFKCFEVECPHCNNPLKLTERLGLIWQCYDQCKFCNQLFQVKRRRIYTNAAVIGTMTGLMSHILMRNELWQSVLLSVLLVVVFQRFVDVFYSLEAVNDDSFI